MQQLFSKKLHFFVSGQYLLLFFAIFVVLTQQKSKKRTIEIPNQKLRAFSL